MPNDVKSPAESVEHFDVIVIGAGSTGTNVAGYARDNGLSVAIVEDRLVGGECSYYACIPSKALLGPLHALAAARRLPGASAAVEGSVDVEAVLTRRDEFISRLDDADQVAWIDSVGAVLVRGRGRLSGERRVDVETDDGWRYLQADRAVVIATGSRPAYPPIDGLADTATWDNRDATTTSRIPDRLAVLGGGVVGCELAQAFRRLGAEVTIVEKSARILANYESWVSDTITEAFGDEGIGVMVGVGARSVRRDGEGGTVVVELDDGTSVEADELLVATGRAFNTDDIGLDAIGLEPGGPLEVDDLLRVTASPGGWLYAAGDVNGRALLTHQGKYQARCVGDTVAGRETSARSDHGAVPQVVFTDPEVASVGITPASDEYHDELRTVSVDISSVAGASLTGQSRGRASIVLDDERGVIVGATFVGPNVGEILHSATIAIVGAVPVDTLWHAVPAFPTVSEIWLRLLEAARGVNA